VTGTKVSEVAALRWGDPAVTPRVREFQSPLWNGGESQCRWAVRDGATGTALRLTGS